MLDHAVKLLAKRDARPSGGPETAHLVRQYDSIIMILPMSIDTEKGRRSRPPPSILMFVNLFHYFFLISSMIRLP